MILLDVNDDDIASSIMQQKVDVLVLEIYTTQKGVQREAVDIYLLRLL